MLLRNEVHLFKFVQIQYLNSLSPSPPPPPILLHPNPLSVLLSRHLYLLSRDVRLLQIISILHVSLSRWSTTFVHNHSLVTPSNHVFSSKVSAYFLSSLPCNCLPEISDVGKCWLFVQIPLSLKAERPPCCKYPMFSNHACQIHYSRSYCIHMTLWMMEFVIIVFS